MRRRMRDGQIPAVKLGEGGSVIRIDAAELAGWLYERTRAHDPRMADRDHPSVKTQLLEQTRLDIK